MTAERFIAGIAGAAVTLGIVLFLLAATSARAALDIPATQPLGVCTAPKPVFWPRPVIEGDEIVARLECHAETAGADPFIFGTALRRPRREGAWR